MLLQTSSLSNQDITSALLVGTYTAALAVSDLSVQVTLDQIAGSGNYTIYTTRQLVGAGSAYASPVITEAVGGVTSHSFAPLAFSINALDVVKVYVTGLPADSATVDINCEFWGLVGASTASGSTSPLYASLAEYKAYIAVRGLSGSVDADTSDDAVIEDILESVSRFIDNRTGRKFYQSSEETRYYTSDNSWYVDIDDFASVTSVSVDYSGLREYDLLLETEYDLFPDNAALDNLPYNRIHILESSGAYLATVRKGVKVIGVSGFPAVPADIKEATLGITQSLYASRSGQTSGGRVTVTGSGIVIRPEDVPPFAQSIIQIYRNIR